MTTPTNYSDRINTPTFETQVEINEFTDGFESQANKERVEIEIGRKLRDETRAVRLAIADPYEGMYGVTTNARFRKQIRRDVLPERRVGHVV
jgi:hypothetical protein